MPTERFFNLPPEKQQRIRDAALQEMERVPFDEISINKIIKLARIPRGSFYQYFEGKDDLLSFITANYRAGLIEIMGKSLAENNGDVFIALQDIFDYTVRYGTNPEYINLFCNLFSSRRMHAQTAAEILQAAQRDAAIWGMVPKVSLERFRYSEPQDLHDILSILILLFRDSIEQISADVENTLAYQASFKNKVKILRDGVMKEEA